jgi:hypothetical protein
VLVLRFDHDTLLVMTTAARKLLDQALDLPDDERLAIASALLESVEGPADPEWDAEWMKEFERRDAAARASATPLAEWSEVRTRVLRRIVAR